MGLWVTDYNEQTRSIEYGRLVKYQSRKSLLARTGLKGQVIYLRYTFSSQERDVTSRWFWILELK